MPRPIIFALSLLALGGVSFAVWQFARADDKPAAPQKRNKVPKLTDPHGESPTDIVQRLERLTDGKRLRAVWMEQNPAATIADPFAKTADFRLVGYDSGEAKTRVLGQEFRCYARPLLTPDGTGVIYTDKRPKPDNPSEFSTEIHLVSWHDAKDRPLKSGYAVDLAQDATGKTWVYYLATFGTDFGDNLRKFELANPGNDHQVWEKAEIGPDNIQVDGHEETLSVSFPGRACGIVDAISGNWKKLASGCWPSVAPDHSDLCWVFHGTHRKLRIFDPVQDDSWEVEFKTAPYAGRHECYHPRWANHPRFFTMTGPYPSGSDKRDATTLTSAGLHAEIFVGKFTADLRAVEGWARLTHNSVGDFYPDLWIEGGESATLENFAQQPKQELSGLANAGPPKKEVPLIFAWQNAAAENRLPERNAPCYVESRGIGRFSPRHWLLLDGGAYDVDAATHAAFAAAYPKTEALTLHFSLTEHFLDPAKLKEARLAALVDAQNVPIIAAWRTAAGIALRGDGIDLTHPLTKIDGDLEVTLRLSDGEISLRCGTHSHVGKIPDATAAKLAAARLILGDTASDSEAWRGEIGRIVWSAEPASADALAAAFPPEAPAPPKEIIKVRGILREITTPETARLGTYRRMLVDHVYEISAVLSAGPNAFGIVPAGTAAPSVAPAPNKMIVLHWGICDNQPIPGIPRQIGQEYELHLTPQAAHPELESELTIISCEDLDLPIFIDASPPAKPAQ